MKIYAIIVTYNGKKWYNKCIGSLMMSSVPIDLVVVDNASTDGTIEYLSLNFPSLYIIRNRSNLGFAEANNIGIKYAMDKGADYIFLLNQDAWVEYDTIKILLKTFSDNEHVGIASPMHLNGEYTKLDKGFCNYIGSECISDAYMNILKPYYSVPFVNAAAWLISKTCIYKVGGFDTCLFKHYGEDDNYAQRVYYHGLKIIINTQCTICHDREARKIDPAQSLFNMDDSYFEERYYKGNILLKYDSDSTIQNKKIALIKSYLGLHFKRIKRIKRDIEFETKVSYSRKINKQGGLAWLS